VWETHKQLFETIETNGSLRSSFDAETERRQSQVPPEGFSSSSLATTNFQKLWKHEKTTSFKCILAWLGSQLLDDFLWSGAGEIWR
jgi:hypothetical protein